MIQYSQHFSNGGTFNNYLGDLRLGHALNQRDVNWDTAVVSRLLRGVKKLTIKCTKVTLLRAHLERLVNLAETEKDLKAACLYATASQFLFRVQSELVPLQATGLKEIPTHKLIHKDSYLNWHSNLKYGEAKQGGTPLVPLKLIPTLTVTLRKRKNKEASSDLLRLCICQDHPTICGVCRLKPFYEKALLRADGRLFPNLNIKEETVKLRRRCRLLDIPGADILGWRAFRRGGASDLLADGSPFSMILAAGGWKGPAALTYLAKSELDRRIDLIRTIDASDSEEE